MSHKKTTEEFIRESNKIHSNKYDYSKTEYVGAHKKVCIICPIHGEFQQEPNMHLRGQGCPKCSGNYKWTTNEWIDEAIKKHGSRYDYSKVNYVNKKHKVEIVCKIHGSFMELPYEHLCGHGCSKCSKKHNYTTEEWAYEANKVHNGRYDYSKTNYINSKTKVCIICKEHGEFLQLPTHHLNGVGCPMCKNVWKLEEKIKLLCDKNDIKYNRQKRFDWLGLQSLDFYLVDYKIAIECQGVQHFRPIRQFGGDLEFNKILERDQRKKILCDKHNVKLFYVNYNEDAENKFNEILNKANGK